jgi:hypothetical protein
VDGDVGQDFAVDFDAGLAQPADQAAVIELAGAAALRRMIHKLRHSRFLVRRWRKLYSIAFITARRAWRWSFDLVRKKPFACVRIFLRRRARLGPRLTRGMRSFFFYDW